MDRILLELAALKRALSAAASPVTPAARAGLDSH